ncbi:MAG: nitroreductase family protein [Bacilli bacterium]|jgi:nitroreductase
MELQNVIKKRQSVREFTTDKVSREDLWLILDAANNAPVGRAAYNRYELIIIDEREKIDHIAKRIADVGALLKPPFFHAPLVIFVAGKVSRERLDGCDTGCLIQTMMLQATELGLGSCFLYTISEIINSHPELLEALEIPDGYTIMSAVVIGHPKEKDLPLKVRPGIKTRRL